FGGTRTVVRAGYGMYYQDEGLGNQYGAAQSAPFVYSIAAITQPGAGRITWSNPFPAASVQKQGFSTRPRDWPVERFQQWNFTIEREVGWNSAVSLAYLGSRVGLGSVGIDSNYPTVAGINPDGTLNQVRPFAAANAVTYQSSLGYYRSHAMQVDLRRRFAQGLSFDGEFLWMKAIDNNWPSSYTGPVSYLPLETGRSAGTRKFTFVDRFLWDLPVGRQRSFFAGMNRALDVAVGGWTLAGIFTAQTGYYFNPTFSNGFAAYGLLGSRPNSVPGARWDQNVPAGSWFNPAAFEAPPQPSGGQVVLGNAGRNTIPGPGLVNLTLII